MSDVIPPAPPARGNGCWKWAAIGCGGGCALVVLAFVVIFAIFGPVALRATASFKKSSERCEAEMKVVWSALERYHKATGRYPERLEQLVPKYVPDRSRLRFSENANGPAFVYHRPEQNAPPDSIVLECPLKLSLPNRPPVPVMLMLRRDGEVTSNGFDVRFGNPSGPGGALPGGTPPEGAVPPPPPDRR